eukprot:TRINITY_DN16544_c0_g2_i2.p1 TRINITY_DN16544_c0_g2~~TRINITY_DN16544_c0_g2_i2.p1  ORF type:complete len:322 (-),score=72.20 TRINITY_DN16544_c0_g2_i2:235-1200(-)
MVTCWTDHLVLALQRMVTQAAGKQELQEKLKKLEAEIRKVFDHHDKDQSGMIEEPEHLHFAVEVAELIEPVGDERNSTISKVFDTIKQIDANSDGSISWSEFWEFVTKPAPGHPIEAPREEQQWDKSFGAYVIVCCQRADGSFLLVHQKDGWWLPGTLMASDETPHQAAERACQEQAGLDIRLEGVLRTEFDSRSTTPGSRLRMVFLGRAINDYDQLKSIPDQHSGGSVWVDGNKVTMENDAIPLAGNEPAVWFDYMLRLGPVYPLSVIASEGAPLIDHPPCAKAHVWSGDSYHGAEGVGCTIEVGGELNSNLGVIYPNSP